MVVLLGVCDGAGGQERAPEQGRAAAVILKDAGVEAAIHLVPAVPEFGEDGLPVDGVFDDDPVFPAGGPFPLRLVAGHLADGGRVAVGDVLVLRLEAHLLRGEGAAEQEERIGLGLHAAGLHLP